MRIRKNPDNAQYIIPWPMEKHLASLSNKDILHLNIENDQITVGYIIIAGLTNPNQSIELTRITIGPKRKGYGKLAFQYIKDYSFRVLMANRLWLDVKTNNTRAIELYEKQGFKLEGTLRECLKTENEFESLHIMSLLKHEYLDIIGD